MTAKKKNKSKPKVSHGGLLSRLRPPRVSLRTAALWLNRGVFAVIVVAAVAGVAFGYSPLRERVGAIRTDPLRVTIDWPTSPGGTWLPIEEQDRLGAIARANLTADPFDIASLDATSAAFAATGWFGGPPTVRRRPGGEVEISGAWRTPAAVVRHGGADHLVASDGALLPMRYAPGTARGMPVIVEPYTGPPTRSGGVPGLGLIWVGGDVTAALGLIEYLRRSPAAASIEAVDVSRYVSENLLVLRMSWGGRVVWGAPPGAGAPGEVADDFKRTRLEQIAREPTLARPEKGAVEIHSRFVLVDETASP